MQASENTVDLLNKLLTFANTGLVALVGFLLREAWSTIHARMDNIQEQQNNMREEYAGRISALETAARVSNPNLRAQ